MHIYIIYKYTYIDIYNTLYICEIYFCNKGISTCAYIHTEVNHTGGGAAPQISAVKE